MSAQSHWTKWKDKGLTWLYLCQISKSIKGSGWWGYASSTKNVWRPQSLSIIIEFHVITVHHNSGLGVDDSLSLWSILSTSLKQKLYQSAMSKAKSWGLPLLFHGIKETDLCHIFIISLTWKCHFWHYFEFKERGMCICHLGCGSLWGKWYFDVQQLRLSSLPSCQLQL